ncbi:unnamed protein product [Owenia fusiformis]|uniref:VWFA domain-containing protein n=1 Tax=Owenia fusiformis TaxID=6347 RepID=A0A8S4MWN6_OWEFU|nr:unnamed protein product [Owenia fusiformis]
MIASSRIILMLVVTYLNAKAHAESNFIAEVTKIRSQCETGLPPEDQKVTLKINCIGKETNGVLRLSRKRFSKTGQKICGAMTTIACTELEPPLSLPKLPEIEKIQDSTLCVDIIFLIDVSCSIAKKYKKNAIEEINRFLYEIKLKNEKRSQNKSSMSNRLSNVAVVPFSDTAEDSVIPFKRSRSAIQKGLKHILKNNTECKTYGEKAYKKAVELFDTIRKRGRSIVVIFGDGRNTGEKHQQLSDQAMDKLKRKHSAEIIWVKVPTKILNLSKRSTELEILELMQGELHIERHTNKKRILDILDNNLHSQLTDYLQTKYQCS